ncbi:hypothetical protein T440DRAFT_509374 [Plenodomus tracheiphilus IPT5]|uniref:Structure-specific endonuclease subunit SLX4 n=1 Tax=Plenodomus tracheiphilus IPT5 TaxID=1408161 RepID=A0A6A7B072_9PLEO|nr:hypothetical protein T440DRAFT_509374 [Plenodomus tracheiphilus IPT5]
MVALRKLATRMAGTTFEIVVLSSSPPEQLAAPPHINGHTPRRVAMPPSSPPRFSPPSSPLRPTIGASGTNARAAPIPEGAVRGFATVGSLVQSEYFVQAAEAVQPDVQQAQSRQGSREDVGTDAVSTKKPRKRPTKTTTTGDQLENPKPKPNPRARKVKTEKEPTAADPELRVPAPKKSPFFGDATTETTAEPPNEIAPKLTKAGKPRKPRARKQTVNDEGVEEVAKPKRKRVTKAKAATKDGKVQREDASVTSAHFRDAAVPGQTSEESQLSNNPEAQATSQDDVSVRVTARAPQPKKKRAAPKSQQVDSLPEGLDLEEAVARRRDWTPPRDTAISTPFTDSVGKENKQLGPNAEGTFTSLVSTFAYAQSPSLQTTATTSSTSIPIKEKMPMNKRRRVELVDIPGHQANSRNSSPDKGKAPKKKPRTITDIVTEQYASKELPPDQNAVTSNTFDAKSTMTKVPLNDVVASDSGAPFKKPPRRRNNSKSDSENAGAQAKPKRAQKKSATKSKPVAEKLLSPSSALSRLSRQDVLFGTSSQLALEESPTMVRQLQRAMKESEKDAGLLDDPFLDGPPRWPKLERTVGRRGLWAESARDAEGGMLEHMEDVYVPEPDRTQEIPLLMDGTYEAPDALGSFIDIDDIEPPPQDVPLSDLPRCSQMAVPSSQDTKAQDVDYPMIDDMFDDIDAFEQEPPPSNQNANSQHSFVDIDDFSPPSATRFRESAPPQIPPPTPMSLDPSPKKRRGRPPKSKFAIPTVKTSSTPKLKPSASELQTHEPSTPPVSTPRFIDIEEILDSEDEALSSFSPTPPRVQRLADLPPLPLASFDGSPVKSPKPGAPDPTLAKIHKIPIAHLEWANIKATTFNKLTAHIRSIPPTTDPKKPSWHEKILMFDPIILEDFTAYLNTHTPIRVYKKATQKQIKAWNSDAKKRGDAGVTGGVGGPSEAEVLAVEKELEAFMVKAWCEGLSVCCINRVRGNGGARKGLY